MSLSVSISSARQGHDHFKAKLDWYAGRYGDEPAVFAWELWNEMDAVRDSEWLDWTRAMLPELRRRFPHNLAVQSLGSYDGERKRDRYRTLCLLTDNDVAQVHRYLDQGADWEICHGPVDLSAAQAVRELIAFHAGKPIILTETGAVKPSHTGCSELYAEDQLRQKESPAKSLRRPKTEAEPNAGTVPAEPEAVVEGIASRTMPGREDASGKPTPETPGAQSPPRRTGISTLTDPRGNLQGNARKGYLDSVGASAREEGANCVFTVTMAEALPNPNQLADEDFCTIVWFVDIDRNRATGQSARGNDYNIHLWCSNKRGWYPGWYKTSDVGKNDGGATFSYSE